MFFTAGRICPRLGVSHDAWPRPPTTPNCGVAFLLCLARNGTGPTISFTISSHRILPSSTSSSDIETSNVLLRDRMRRLIPVASCKLTGSLYTFSDRPNPCHPKNPAHASYERRAASAAFTAMLELASPREYFAGRHCREKLPFLDISSRKKSMVLWEIFRKLPLRRGSEERRREAW